MEGDAAAARAGRAAGQRVVEDALQAFGLMRTLSWRRVDGPGPRRHTSRRAEAVICSRVRPPRVPEALRVPGQAALRRRRVPTLSAGCAPRRGGGAGGGRAGRAGRRQGPGADRRARQGRRHPEGGRPGPGRRTDRGAAGARAARHAGPACLARAAGRCRAGAVPRLRPRCAGQAGRLPARAGRGQRRGGPEAIFRAPVDLAVGLPLFLVRDGLLGIGLPQTLAAPLHGVASALLEALEANAATLAEINPLALVARAPLENEADGIGAPLTQPSPSGRGGPPGRA